jgi:hypothetical protein
MKICSVEAEVFHADGRTDIRTDITKLTVTYRDFANASENGKEKPTKRHCRSMENIIYNNPGICKILKIIHQIQDNFSWHNLVSRNMVMKILFS